MCVNIHTGKYTLTHIHILLVLCVLICFSHARLCVTPRTVAHQAPLSMGFSRQGYWSGLPCPPPGHLPHPGIEPSSLRFPTLAGGLLTSSTTWEALTGPSSAHHEEVPFPPPQTHLLWILLPPASLQSSAFLSLFPTSAPRLLALLQEKSCLMQSCDHQKHSKDNLLRERKEPFMDTLCLCPRPQDCTSSTTAILMRV